MKKKVKNEIDKRFFIKRSKVNAISTRENQLSEEIKAFRKVAPKMEPGDSFQCNALDRHKIHNFLRYRKLKGSFKGRLVSNKEDIVEMFCVKKLHSYQLL